MYLSLYYGGYNRNSDFGTDIDNIYVIDGKTDVLAHECGSIRVAARELSMVEVFMPQVLNSALKIQECYLEPSFGRRVLKRA